MESTTAPSDRLNKEAVNESDLIGCPADGRSAAGCAPKAPKTIYYWGDYQQQIYSYYQKKDSDPQKQIEALDLDTEKARTVNQPVAPGLHAQLGLLYAKTGNTNKAFSQFATEKQLFPEAGPYMDFLMSNKQGVTR